MVFVRWSNMVQFGCSFNLNILKKIKLWQSEFFIVFALFTYSLFILLIVVGHNSWYQYKWYFYTRTGGQFGKKFKYNINSEPFKIFLQRRRISKAGHSYVNTVGLIYHSCLTFWKGNRLIGDQDQDLSGYYDMLREIEGLGQARINKSRSFKY
jgi:hypothetical protein